MKALFTTLAFAACLLLAAVLTAAPRTWSSSDGRFQVEAELVEFDGKIARLRVAGNKVVDVPVENLSQADRQHLETLNQGAAPPTPATADVPADAAGEKAARDALDKLGVRVISTGLALEDEAKLSKGLRDLFAVRKKLIDATKQYNQTEAQDQQLKDTITRLTQLNVQLNARLIGTKDITTHNKLISALNGNDSQIELVQGAREKLAKKISEARSAMNQARETYIQEVLDLRKMADTISNQYKTKAAEAKVRSAVADLNRATGKSYQLAHSSTFRASLRRLKVIEDTVLSEAIPLREEQFGTLLVSVVVDGKYTEEMIVDSGASSILLPAKTANKLGVEVKADAPLITLVMADGREIQGKRVVLAKVRVGKFTVENVEAVVLGANAVAAEPLLGMSFLGHFKFEVNSQQRKLTMVKVETPGGK